MTLKLFIKKGNNMVADAISRKDEDVEALLCALSISCGHNLPPLYFDPLEKNIMATPLKFKSNTTISYL